MFILLLAIAILAPIGRTELNPLYDRRNNNDNQTNLPRHRSDLNKLHRNNQNYLIPADQEHCRRQAICIPLANTTCMGIKLPYDRTTFELIDKKISESMIEDKLHLLQSLKHIPKCWAVVQPFLCSLFKPKCVDYEVDLPSQEMCRVVMGPCRLVLNHTMWPTFIKCEDEKLFPRRCMNDMREIKFNTTGKCLSPLVPTDNSLAVFEGVENCGSPCNDPMYTIDEKKQVYSLIAWGAGTCAIFNLFAVITFLIDWRSANKYPPVVIFYINCCFFISCIGWLIQFTPGSRELIVCRKDNTLRISEPNGENLTCVIIFVMIYYSLIAAMVWFVILTYAWHVTFQAIEKIQNRIDKKGAYFHLLAWCLPLMLTVTIIASGEIDGNHTTGICFVGYSNHAMRAWFVLGPVTVAATVGGYFLLRALITLIRLQPSSQEFLSEKASAKIRETIVRMGLFLVFTLSAVVMTFYCHIYEFQHSWEWKQSFREFMICSITTRYSEVSECKLRTRPSAAKLQLHLIAPFFVGVLMSSWVWTGSTVNTWMRFFKRTFHGDTEEPIRLKKHKVIAQAFAKRKTFNNAGRLSISFHNTHDDPVGLNFHLNSAASQDFSSTWAAALPTLVTRRGAIAVQSASISSNRRNSTDSQYSFSVRRVSVESRRNSYDSQIAVTEFELKTSRVNKSKRRKKTTQRSKNRKCVPVMRKGSATSQESQLGLQILNALSMSSTKKPEPQVPNMKRRSACVGLEDVKNAERILPFLFRNNHSDTDENSSSDEKLANDKNIDVEAGLKKKRTKTEAEAEDNNGTDNEDSQADEETKMLNEPETKKSTITNSQNCERSKEETVLKQLLQEAVNDQNILSEADKKNAINNLASGLSRLIQSTESHSKAREIATQTSLPLEVLEIEELKQSIGEIINNRNCCSKGTQISPLLKKSKKQPK